MSEDEKDSEQANMAEVAPDNNDFCLENFDSAGDDLSFSAESFQVVRSHQLKTGKSQNSLELKKLSDNIITTPAMISTPTATKPKENFNPDLLFSDLRTGANSIKNIKRAGKNGATKNGGLKYAKARPKKQEKEEQEDEEEEKEESAYEVQDLLNFNAGMNKVPEVFTKSQQTVKDILRGGAMGDVEMLQIFQRYLPGLVGSLEIVLSNLVRVRDFVNVSRLMEKVRQAGIRLTHEKYVQILRIAGENMPLPNILEVFEALENKQSLPADVYQMILTRIAQNEQEYHLYIIDLFDICAVQLSYDLSTDCLSLLVRTFITDYSTMVGSIANKYLQMAHDVLEYARVKRKVSMHFLQQVLSLCEQHPFDYSIIIALVGLSENAVVTSGGMNYLRLTQSVFRSFVNNVLTHSTLFKSVQELLIQFFGSLSPDSVFLSCDMLEKIFENTVQLQEERALLEVICKKSKNTAQLTGSYVEGSFARAVARNFNILAMKPDPRHALLFLNYLVQVSAGLIKKELYIKWYHSLVLLNFNPAVLRQLEAVLAKF